MTAAFFDNFFTYSSSSSNTGFRYTAQPYLILELKIASAIMISFFNAKNMKKLHCQCKLGKKTRQSNAKNIKNLHCQCKFEKKTCQIDAKNIKNLHCQRKNFKNLTCQCKKYKKFALPMQKI